MNAPRPYLTVTFHDDQTAVEGYLVIDRLVGGLAAGGLRVSPTLSLAELCALARNMTRKQAAVGIEVGGAKAGVRMAANDSRKAEVLGRFLDAIRPSIETCFSCGPDVNTTLKELEMIASARGLPSLKIAVARRRGVDERDFLRRYALFESATPLGTVNELRAPTAVKAAVMACLRHLDCAPAQSRVAIQGAGNMGGGSARLIDAAGCKVVSWADERMCLQSDRGLDVVYLLAGRDGTCFSSTAQFSAEVSSRVLSAHCDVLVLAAVSDAIPLELVPNMRARAVVVAANLGLSDAAEKALSARGVLIVPDLIASAGGSLAAETLYLANPKDGMDILKHVEQRAELAAMEFLKRSSPRTTD